VSTEVAFSAFQKFGVVLAVLAVTLLFTVVHVPQYSLNNVPDYATISTLLMLSLTLTLVRVKTGNLYPCIVLHTVVNGIQSIVLIAEPYLPKSITDVPDPTSMISHILR
jgi:membrane protease YdiL (CAAX protease family)